MDPVRIILSGVAVNSVLGGYNSFLQLQNSDNLNGVLSFMNGSFSGGNWTQVRVMAVYAVIGLVHVFVSEMPMHFSWEMKWPKILAFA